MQLLVQGPPVRLFLPGTDLLVIVAAIICSLFRSLWLNRGINRNDLKLLTRENFRKLFKSRIEIMTGTKG